MSSYKQSSDDFYARIKRERREQAAAAAEAGEARARRNALLKAHGYSWRKYQDIGGPSDDGDSAAMIWQLFAPDGSPVTVAQALAAIAATPSPAP